MKTKRINKSIKTLDKLTKFQKVIHASQIHKLQQTDTSTSVHTHTNTIHAPWGFDKVTWEELQQPYLNCSCAHARSCAWTAAACWQVTSDHPAFVSSTTTPPKKWYNYLQSRSHSENSLWIHCYSGRSCRLWGESLDEMFFSNLFFHLCTDWHKCTSSMKTKVKLRKSPGSGSITCRSLLQDSLDLLPPLSGFSWSAGGALELHKQLCHWATTHHCSMTCSEWFRCAASRSFWPEGIFKLTILRNLWILQTIIFYSSDKSPKMNVALILYHWVHSSIKRCSRTSASDQKLTWQNNQDEETCHWSVYWGQGLLSLQLNESWCDVTGWRGWGDVIFPLLPRNKMSMLRSAVWWWWTAGARGSSEMFPTVRDL